MKKCNYCLTEKEESEFRPKRRKCKTCERKDGRLSTNK